MSEDPFRHNGYCKHDKRSCIPCQKLSDKRYDFGLFEWRSDGRYYRGTAIRVFPTKGRAQQAADKHSGNVVVRELEKERT
jgi:hypothetical protein